MRTLPYDFDKTVDTLKDVVAKRQDLRTHLLDCNDRDFNLLRYGVTSALRFLRYVDSEIKAASIERRTNYTNLVVNAKKMFIKLDIEILEVLLGIDSDSAYYLRGIFSHLNNEENGPSIKYHRDSIHKRIKLLKRRGLVEVRSGLFDDDGFTAGSGYSIPEHKRDCVEQVINEFYAKRPKNAKMIL